MATVAQIIEELERLAPPDLAEEGDPIGLQVGSVAKEVRRIAVAVDTSTPVVNAAIDREADLLVAHHPLIHKPLRAVIDDDPVSARVSKLVRADVSVYVMHTNYDIVPGGVSDVLAETLGVRDCSPLALRKQDKLHKICVFVPEEAVDQVRNAMAEAGAGRIGQYTHCSYRTRGVGSFVPLAAAQPYIGATGKLEEVEEWRLEMICAGSWLEPVLAEMIEKHPYDEVAYDVYELANEPVTYGLGRIGTLEEEMSLGEFADRVKSALVLDGVRVAGDASRKVRKVALCGGGGSSLYADAVEGGADLLVTGDTRHHDVLNALDLNLAVIDAGHHATEKPGVATLAKRLRKMLAPEGIEVDCIDA